MAGMGMPQRVIWSDMVLSCGCWVAIIWVASCLSFGSVACALAMLAITAACPWCRIMLEVNATSALLRAPAAEDPAGLIPRLMPPEPLLLPGFIPPELVLHADNVSTAAAAADTAKKGRAYFMGWFLPSIEASTLLCTHHAYEARVILFRARVPTLTPGGISRGGARQAAGGRPISAGARSLRDQIVDGMAGRRCGRGEQGRGLLEVALELGLRRVVVAVSRVPREPLVR